MTESIKIRLPEAKSTVSCGRSLTASLYTFPVTLFLDGELGAGKTTFVQGFAEALGIKERLTSPTYALEQRYLIPSPDGGGLGRGGKRLYGITNFMSTPSPQSSPAGRGRKPELLHIDLYRISPKEAKELVHSTDDFEGIRCIEWSEKIAEKERVGAHIDLRFEDTSHPLPFIPSLREGYPHQKRILHIQFHDIPLPTRIQIEQWRTEVALLKPICRHCDTVGKFAEKIAHVLLKRGIIVRPKTVRRAGELHDLLRFLDFKHPPPDPPRVWKEWKKKYPNRKHESACALFLRAQGFDALTSIIEPHGLMLPSPDRCTIEQKVLFYADKRTIVDRVVSIDERFEDFKQRYGEGKISAQHIRWYEEVKAIEKELFPDGLPLP